MGSELKDHRVSIRVDLTSKLPLVSGNKSQLQEVVSNLIINSIEAMEATSLEGRLLLIQTEIQGDNIAVAVEDSGPGIDKDQLGDIFTPFATTKAYGMGLGLAISRMIIDYHGGKLTAASDSKCGGASFHFVLPTADRVGAQSHCLKRRRVRSQAHKLIASTASVATDRRMSALGAAQSIYEWKRRKAN